MTNESTGTVIELTREFVANAIESEAQLVPGTWISRADEPRPNCPACAVGSVMRRALDAAETTRNVFESCEDNARSVEAPDGSYVTYSGTTDDGCEPASFAQDVIDRAASVAHSAPMTALSYVFESLHDLYRSKTDRHETVRIATVAFVREHFPETIRVNINGFAAAADVRVVSR